MRGRRRATPVALAIAGIPVLVLWLVPSFRQSIEANWNWIAVLFVFILTGQAVWSSTGNFQQARLLRRAVRVGVSGLSSDRPAAVYGQVRVHGPLRKSRSRAAKEFTGNCLWWRVVKQKLIDEGWETVDEEVGTARFALDCDGREIHIRGDPTEVQCARRESTRQGGFLANIPERTVTKWLPVQPRLTVLGRLERDGENLTMVESPEVGLLFSPVEPVRAARKEKVKGIAGLVLVGLGLAAIRFLSQVS